MCGVGRNGVGSWSAKQPEGGSQACSLTVLEEMTAEKIRADVLQGPEHVVQRKLSFTGEYPEGLWDLDLDP